MRVLKHIISSLFLKSHECGCLIYTLAFKNMNHYTPAKAEVPWHTHDNCGVTLPNHSDALADRSNVRDAKGKRQAGAPHCLFCARLPVGPYRPRRATTGIHRRKRFRRHHWADPTQFQPKRGLQWLDCGHCGSFIGHLRWVVVPKAAQELKICR